MENNLNRRFENLAFRYSSVLERNIQKRLKKARDKEFTAGEIKKLVSSVNNEFESNSEIKKMIDLFSSHYKLGEPIDVFFSVVREVYVNSPDDSPTQQFEEDNDVSEYLADEKKELKQLAADEKRLIRLLVRFVAFQEIEKKLPDILSLADKKGNKERVEQNPVKWTSIKDNKNDFVQLVYGLHKAGYINKGKGEITKIVETLAETFQVDLGKNWQSNLSSSIHKSKHGYEPPIFNKIRQAYQYYSEDQITAKKSNK